MLRDKDQLGLTLATDAVQRGVIELLEGCDPAQIDVTETPQLSLEVDPG
jgi:hypothetical protein